jgi:hypothetical protein
MTPEVFAAKALWTIIGLVLLYAALLFLWKEPKRGQGLKSNGVGGVMENKEDVAEALLTAQSGTWRGSWMEKLRPRYAAIIQSDRKAVAALFVPALRALAEECRKVDKAYDVSGCQFCRPAFAALATAEREGWL